MHIIACDFLPPLACACFPPFEQLIRQQMVQPQDSISEHLHHNTLSIMLFDRTSEVHCAQILSCSSSRVGTWLTTWLVFPTFQLSSSNFYTTFYMWLGLPNPSIVGIPWCVHPIDLMGIHFLCCVHGNEHTITHDAICDTFVAITWDVGFHVGWEQLHALPSTTFNSFCWRINIVLTNDDIHTLADAVNTDPLWTYLLPWSCAIQKLVALDASQTKERSCCNPSLGLATKARACKVAGQEGNSGVMSHAPMSVRKCEGMNPHIPKGASTLGVGVLVDSRIFRERLQGSNSMDYGVHYIIKKFLNLNV